MKKVGDSKKSPWLEAEGEMEVREEGGNAVAHREHGFYGTTDSTVCTQQEEYH